MTQTGQRIVFSCRSISFSCKRVEIYMLFSGCSVKYLQVLIRVNKCWKCSLQHVHVKCRHNVLVSPSIRYYVKQMENHNITLYISTALCQPQIGQLGCAHNLFVSRVATLCMHEHHMTTCLITCEWQSFLGVTMLVTERLLLVSESYGIWYSSRTCLWVLCKFLQLF